MAWSLKSASQLVWLVLHNSACIQFIILREWARYLSMRNEAGRQAEQMLMQCNFCPGCQTEEIRGGGGWKSGRKPVRKLMLGDDLTATADKCRKSSKTELKASALRAGRIGMPRRGGRK